LQCQLTQTDGLTGLPNRGRFAEKLASLTAERADGGGSFAVMIVNLDGFKPINDVYGHTAGDDVLRQAANRLEGVVLDRGVVARIGGDEFGVLARSVAGPEEVAELGETIGEVLSAPFDLEGRKLRLSGSCGAAVYPEAGTTPAALLERAETALYRAKKSGRGKTIVFSKTLEAGIKEEAKIEQALRQAIAEGAIAPHYQPIVELRTGRILGFEALARWTDPELGFVPPSVFIPIAEERGLIGELTDMLLLRAARDAMTWAGDMLLSFNLSPTQLSDPTTSLKVLAILNKAGLPPSRLDVEITETAVMSDPKTATEIINALRQAGVRVALDDFGTGHSSLGYLRQLTLDKVKIDRSFVAGLGRERQSDHIIRAILEMCAGLELKVVAEGIEEADQATSLRDLGCGYGQGYLFGKPMEARQALRLSQRAAAAPLRRAMH